MPFICSRCPSKRWKSHFQELLFQNFLGEDPTPPLVHPPLAVVSPSKYESIYSDASDIDDDDSDLVLHEIGSSSDDYKTNDEEETIEPLKKTRTRNIRTDQHTFF